MKISQNFVAFPEDMNFKELSETDLVESPVRFDTWALFVTGFEPAETVKFEDDEVGNFIFLLLKIGDLFIWFDS